MPEFSWSRKQWWKCVQRVLAARARHELDDDMYRHEMEHYAQVASEYEGPDWQPIRRPDADVIALWDPWRVTTSVGYNAAS